MEEGEPEFAAMLFYDEITRGDAFMCELRCCCVGRCAGPLGGCACGLPEVARHFSEVAPAIPGSSAPCAGQSHASLPAALGFTPADMKSSTATHPHPLLLVAAHVCIAQVRWADECIWVNRGAAALVACWMAFATGFGLLARAVETAAQPACVPLAGLNTRHQQAYLPAAMTAASPSHQDIEEGEGDDGDGGVATAMGGVQLSDGGRGGAGGSLPGPSGGALGAAQSVCCWCVGLGCRIGDRPTLVN